MREYLFRGQRVDTKEWVYGDLHKNKEFTKAHIHPIGERVKSVDVIPRTVGQFTGLYDSTKWEELTEEERERFVRKGGMPSEWKGKRIFEGDVVRGEFLWSDIVGQVVWGEYIHSKCDEYSCEHYGWYVKPIREVKNNLYKNTGWDLYSMGMVEVIDNIHDTEGGAE